MVENVKKERLLECIVVQEVVVKEEAKISKIELRNSNTFKIKTSLSFQSKHDQTYYLMLR